MAKLSANGSEFARFEINIHQEGGWVSVVQHSVRLKTFATKPARIVILRKTRATQPLAGKVLPWTGWKHVATASTREGALRWHDRKGFTQIAGDTRRDA